MAVSFPPARKKAPPAPRSSRPAQRSSRRRRDIPAAFIEQLYGRAVPEDVVRYAPDDLAALAARAYDFIAERAPGAPKIRCETCQLTASGDRNSVTVVEIVNDDMPFLVDSVMGEIAERRLDVHLVAHPVFGVRRDGQQADGARRARRCAARARASSIFISRRSRTMPARAELVRALQTCSTKCGWRCRTGAPMLERVNGIVTELKTNPPPLPVDEIAEAIQFLQWLLADNFTFLGVRDYSRRRPGA